MNKEREKYRNGKIKTNNSKENNKG